jgi:rhamnose transport system permease protein
MKAWRRELAVGATLAALLALLAAVAPAFFGGAQLASLASGTAPVLVVACGMALVMVARHIDISVGSQFAWCSVIAALAARAGWPMPLAAGTAVLAGAAMGAANGALVAGLGLPSIVVTLATMVTWREALRWIRGGEFVGNLPDAFQWFGAGQRTGQALVCGAAAAVLLALAWGSRRLAMGRWVYAVGSDAEAARLAGIPARRVTFGVLVVLGGLTGLAAVLNAVRFADVDPKTGTGLEMQAIAAAVVGGVAVRGGRGRLGGVLLGVLLLACIAPALVFLRVPPQWEKAVQGAIILAAVAAEGTGRKR